MATATKNGNRAETVTPDVVERALLKRLNDTVERGNPEAILQLAQACAVFVSGYLSRR